MGEFGAPAPEIVPDPAQDRVDLGGRFFRKCGNQILSADAVFRQQRTDRAHQPATEIGHPVGIGEAQTLEQRKSESAQQRVADALAAAPNHSTYSIRHQKFTMTLPNTCRLSSRARPRSKSASVTSVSMIGAMPAAIFDRLSRILRIEAPNEPKILYCCWNSCIRLMVTVGPAVEPQVTSRPPRLRQNSEALKPSPPTCSKTTSTPFLAVSLRVTPSKRSVL